MTDMKMTEQKDTQRGETKQDHFPQKGRTTRGKRKSVLWLLCLCLLLPAAGGCLEAETSDAEYVPVSEETGEESSENSALASYEEEEFDGEDSQSESGGEEESYTGTVLSDDAEVCDSIEDVPDYSGTPYVVINANQPAFTQEELSNEESYESYSELDELGRCGSAIACIGQDLMPDEERGSIGEIRPSGWHTVKYDCVDGLYLYNRCHLIAYMLSGENANEENLITGTRYLNTEGMLPFEELVAAYVEETGYHVLYRVTPIFEGENLVASGVQMEAESIEDGGEGICFNVYVYNVQPYVEIDYATGDSCETEEAYPGADEDASEEGSESETDTAQTAADSSGEAQEDTADDTESELTYILNTNTMKFHYPECSSVNQMSESNKEEYTGNREDLIEAGYSPCGRCNP